MIYKVSMVLFSNKYFYKIFKKIYNLAAHITGFANFDFQNSGEYSLIKKISKDVNTVVDIGAGTGTFYKLINNQKIEPFNYFGFEPNPESFKALNQELSSKNSNNIKLYEYAIGNVNTNTNLYFYKDKSKPNHSSLYKESFETIHKKDFESLEVKIIKLDELIEKIRNFDLIKIDVEGNLLEVINGMQKIVSTKNVKFILFELNKNEYIKGVSFEKIYNAIGNNFKFYKLLRNGYIEISPHTFLVNEYGCNIVAVSDKVDF